jgi:hypothetical protein
MDFKSGNSGNLLREAVLKIGDGCLQEGAFCQYLTSKIAPEVFALTPNGYVMEKLRAERPTEDSLIIIEEALEEHVWNRPAIPISNDEDWVRKLQKFGVFAHRELASEPCLSHGDPTLSNLLWRDDTTPILADPRPPRDFIPQCRETDMGRIMQSFYGWECAAYNWPDIPYERPRFMRDPKIAAKANFWAFAASARILHLELSKKKQNPRILNWCNSMKELM